MHLLKIQMAPAALALFILPVADLPADEVVASAKKLAGVASFLPALQREEVRHKALAIVLLAEYGRLLPPGLSPGQWEVLENMFLEGRFEDSVRRKQAADMPAADTVSFDGVRLDGGGFARIDSIIGTNGSPVALDRRLPTRLVPLNQGEADRLQQAAADFFATPAAGSIRERTDALYRARLDKNMVDDGIFCRPYAGRTDDLYYRLVQENPGPTSEMNFYAIAESLPGRHYHPLTGIGSPAFVPSPWFNVSEVLSGGGLLAVEDFKSRNPHADVRNPFFGFAARVLPFLGPGLETSRPGGELSVSKDVIRRAIESSLRFTPKPVEPIFNDPSHFFGCLVPQFIRVARRMTRAEMAEEFRKIDFDTPLPDVADEPAGNEVLVNPSKWSKAEFFQELPALLALDSAPQFNPDTDLFAAPPEGSGQQPVPPAPGAPQPSATTEVVLVQPLPGPQQVVATPPQAEPLPSPMPIVASLPSLSHPAAAAEPSAPPDAEPSPPAMAAATPAPPAPIAVPAEIGIPGSSIAMLEAPQVLPADLLSPELPLKAAAPAPPFGSNGLGGVERGPRLLFSLQAGSRDGRSTLNPPISFMPFPFAPLLADRIAPAAPPAPEKAIASTTPPPAAKPTPPALAAATPAPPAPIAVPAETEIPDISIAMLEAPPVLPVDLISPELPLPATAPALAERADPSPAFGPLLADPIAPAAPQAPEESIPEKAAASIPLPPAAELPPPALAAATPPLPVPAPIIPNEAVASASPSQEPSASLSPLPVGHYLAVVTPDISASEKYLGDIAASDAVLSKNAAALSRTNCYLQWLKAALDPVEAYLDSSPGLAQAQMAELQAASSAAGNELNSLLENRHSLGKERDQLLAERGRLRSAIEGEPIRLTSAKLDALLGRPIEGSKSLAALGPSKNPWNIPQVFCGFVDVGAPGALHSIITN